MSGGKQSRAMQSLLQSLPAGCGIRGNADKASREIRSAIMKQTHTPGPWEVNLETGEITANGPVVLGTIYGADDFPCNENDITEECNANARLIAAAPELLDALQDLWQFVLDNTGDDCGCVMADYPVGIYASGPCSHCKAKAAIAKAKGEQS
jgi:hypothetical protein